MQKKIHSTLLLLEIVQFKLGEILILASIIILEAEVAGGVWMFANRNQIGGVGKMIGFCFNIQKIMEVNMKLGGLQADRR